MSRGRGAGRRAFPRAKFSYAVQDLRCQIAMKLGLPFDRVQADCARMMELLPKAVKK